MTQILINEFYRGGNLTSGDEFIELLLVEDLTAAQLESFFVGDSTSAKASKFSAFDFTNLSSIASNFPAGTIIAVGGTGRFAQNTSYNPVGGDWNILLNAGGSFLPNAGSSPADIAGDDIVWVDTTSSGNTISPDGFAVEIGTGGGAFVPAANVNFGGSTNNTGYALNTDLAGATSTANWTTNIPTGSTTPGQPNGGANTTYINSLRSIIPPVGTIVTIEATDASAAEAGTDPGTFRITRTGSTTNSLNVSYTVGGTATNGVDYTPNLTNTATIAATQSFVDITITPVDDAIVEGNETATLTLVDTADYNLGANSTATVTIADDDLPVTRIYNIQGATHRSPLIGQSVQNVPGIVTAVDSNGFYFQDATGDNDIATSDGIFVFTSSTPSVSVGDSVQVTGSVSEFVPGGTGTGNLSTTQISGSPTITVVSSGNALPAPVILGVDRTPPTQIIDNDQITPYNVRLGEGLYQPNEDGIDFYESLEGMRVTINDALAVSPTNQFGEIYTVVNNGANATSLSARGTINIDPDDFNPERVQVDEDPDVFDFDFPDVNVGAQLGDVTGVITYNFGNFEVVVTEDFTSNIQPSNLQPETTSIAPTQDRVTIANYNVLNLDPSDGSSRFNAIANQIVNNLQLPDIIGLQEVQDNDGPTNSSITSADQTLQLLVNAIQQTSGVTYEFIDNPFISDDRNGGEPGGNIRTAFLYNPNRVSLASDPLLNQPFQGSVQTVVDPLDQATNPNNPFFDTRLPLVGFFNFNGQEVTVITNHFSSKGGSSPLFGQIQPATDLQEDPSVNGSLDQRQAQAQAVKDYVDNILANNSHANVVVGGDLNEFEFISPLNILEQSLTNLTETLPEDERYSFIFDGNSQALDHTLVSDNLIGSFEYDIVHVNTEFADNASDHDPVLAGLTLPLVVGTKGFDSLMGTPNNDLIQGLEGNDILVGFAGNDILSGGKGFDRLTGGDGSDQFIFNTGEPFNRRDAGIDAITDFTDGDKIVLSKTTFTALNSTLGDGFSDISDFAVVTNGIAARISPEPFVYNSQNGVLYYEGDLVGFVIGKPALSAEDFRIIA
jgi:predicted extracellular nuclease